MKLKVNDNVKIVRNQLEKNNHLVGKVFKVIDVKEGSDYPYKLNDNSKCRWAFNELELVDKVEEVEALFTLEDLKERYIAVLRDGQEYMVADDGDLILVIDGLFKEVYLGFDDYKNDLTNKYNKDLDIVEIFKPKYDKIWERKVETKEDKEMTIADVEKLLDNKYNVKIVD